jgi:DNA-binding response OmpR family regulator
MTALSVLVIEDDAMVGTFLTEMLEDMGYNVCAIAATEDGAVSEAARCKPGLLIVDEQLREGSGAAAVTRILRVGSIPCIFMSGAPPDPRRPGAIMLQKPFHEKDLVRAIRHVVGSADTPATLTPAPAYRVPHGCRKPGYRHT